MRTYDWVVATLRQAVRWFTLVVGSLAAVVVVVGSVFVLVAQVGPLSLRVALGVVGAGAALFVLWYGSREDRGLRLASASEDNEPITPVRDDLDPEFSAMIESALLSIPEDLRDRISNVVFVVEDEPPDGSRWLGTYRGLALPRQSVWHGWSWPHQITLYRGPLERIANGDRDRLAAEVKHVVLHEVAHYFGISDQRLVEIGRY